MELAESEIPIPDELLSEIISQYIPLCLWSRSLENVSKQFQRCVLIAYSRKKSINCRKLFSLTKIKGLRNFLDGDENENCARMNQILEKLIAVCPNLADIVGFDFVLRNMQGISVFWDILSQFDRLQSISLKSIKNIEFQAFANFVANSKNLKILDIDFCEFDGVGTLDVCSLSDVSFCNLDTVMSPEIYLENLSENLIALTLNSLECLQNPREALKLCCNLERFSINLRTANDQEIFLNSLPSLTKLTSLCVVCYTGSQSSIFETQFFYQLNFLKNQLRCFEYNHRVISEEIVCFLLTEFSQLETFRIYGLSAASASKSPSRLPANLKTLTLSGLNAGKLTTILMPNLINLTNFTDISIIGHFSTELTELDNFSCLVNLQNLRLDGRFVDDALLVRCDQKNGELFKKLISLKLGDSSVSDIGGILVAKKAQNLKTLDLPLSRISDKTISVLTDVAKKLTEINLFQFEPYLFDEHAVIGLIKSVTCLKKVTVYGALMDKIRGNENFFPFVANVEIKSHLCSL